MLKLVKDELGSTEKNIHSGLLSEFIMFNLGNTNSYLTKPKLQAILKNGLRQQIGNHPVIIRKNNLHSCFSYGITEICISCSSEIVHPVYCLDYKICPICNRIYSNKRGQRMYEKFDLLGTEYMIHLVLTLPAGYFSKELDKFDIINKLHSLASLFIREFYGENINGSYKVHTNSTKNPLADPHFHIHCLISDKKYYTISQKTLSGSEHNVGFGQKKDIKVYQDVQKMRDIWRKILNYAAEVNLYHQYSNKPAQKRHWCKYICRDPIYDINAFLWKKGKNYQLSPGELKNYAYQVQNKLYFKKIRYFGEYSDSKIANLYYSIYRKNIQNAYSSKKYLELCPVCLEILPGIFENTVKITEKTKFPVLLSEEEYEFHIKRLKK
ncbi:hypothetical protein ES708_22139 [subsurface metagenome]